MAYSEWQLRRVRDALRAHYHYARGLEDEPYTWRDTALAISDHGDLDVPDDKIRAFAERLRQFVEGVNDKKGGRRYPVPTAKRIEAIVGYVLEENLLSKDELEEFQPAHQAPLRLLEYLDQASDEQRYAPPEKLCALYHWEEYDGRRLTKIELALQGISDEGLIQVVETKEIFDKTTAAQLARADAKERKERRSSISQFGGWAILTPEDTLLFFMKEEESARNHYYISALFEPLFWTDDPLARLVLLYHDYPIELDDEPTEQGEMLMQLGHALKENIRCFQRADEAKG